MKSLKNTSKEELTGRAIAQSMRAEQAQHEKNMAKAAKRQQTMLERAAEQALSGRGSAM